jgi:SecD/SecF fusion protein
MNLKKRNRLILLFVAGLLAASAFVIATQQTRLGLDLQGGVELVYQGQPTPQSKVDSASLNRAIEIMRNRVDALGVAEPEIQRSGSDQITVGLPSVSNVQRAEKQVGTPAQLAFYDWEANVIAPNGKPAASELDVKNPDAVKLMSFAGDPAGGMQLIKAVTLASKQPVRGGTDISRVGPQYWLFNATGTKLLAGPDSSTKDLYSEFPNHLAPAGSKLMIVPQGTVVLRAVYRNNSAPKEPTKAKWYVLRDQVALLGKEITNPKQGLDNNSGGLPDVEFGFTDKGQAAFQNVTRTIAQRGQAVSPLFQPQPAVQHFAVALDQNLISVASVDYRNLPDGIDGRNGAIITGGFTIGSAQDLAKLLELGALPIGLKLISQSQVSATLGKQALDQGLVAGLVGLAVVMLFLLAFYRLLGLIACVALVIYSIYLFALVKLIPITLTLPGIAGLILTIGVAADANIVIFERVKEEVRAGRTIPAAIAQGYKRGLSSIIDANVVTLMTAFILFVLATAGVKGFAFTLGVGTIVSLLTAVVATQAALGTLGTSRLSSPAMLGVSGKERNWTFDFMGASKIFFTISGVILLVGALSIGGKGLNFGIDFTSGTRIVTAVGQPTTENQVRDLLAKQGVTDAKIQKVSNKALGTNGFQISTRQLEPAKVGRVQTAMDSAFHGTSNFSSESVGPTFGRTVANSAVLAIIASLLVISAYIALRFEWKFAVPVLIALMHDLLITAGVYSLTGRELTTATVAALLTILGYSLYDTIIVFDRIRENLPRMPRAAFSQIVNRSMSEVLTRSLATSFSTLLPILALLLFGGATLQDFAFALLVGVASGTYSSIFIASPVLTYWKEREPGFHRRAIKLAEASPTGKLPAYYEGAIAPVAERSPAKGRSAATGDVVEEISDEEFKRLAAEVAQDVEEAEATSGDKGGSDPSFVHAPDAAEDDASEADPKTSSAKRKRPHGRKR